MIAIGQSEWGGGKVSSCGIDDFSCLNVSCQVESGAFDSDFCTGDTNLIFHSEGKIRIYGTFQYLQEHIVKGEGEAGGWDNDPDVFDVNLDGHPDFVVTDESFPGSQDSVWVFYNDGDGNFNQVNVGWDINSVDEIHENDADGDGDIDLFTVGDSPSDHDVILFVQISPATWEKCVICMNLNGDCGSSSPGSGEAEGIYTGDLDNDGDVDIAVTHLNDGALYVFEKVPAGTPGAYGCSIPGEGDFYYVKHFIDDPNKGGGWNVIIRDVDMDGDSDIVVTFDRAIRLYRNEGNFNFTGSNLQRGNRGFYGLAMDDINNDGYVDIAVTKRSADKVTLLFNDGSGNFSSGGSFSIPHPMGIVVNDVEDDGDKDIFVASYEGGSGTSEDSTIYVIVNEGGTFVPRNQSFTITRRGYFGVGSGDLDGDGDGDILVRAGNFSYQEGLYWYAAVLYYEDSATIVSNILDVNGPIDASNWRWDSLIVSGKNLELLNVYVRHGKNRSQFDNSTWQNINSLATCSYDRIPATTRIACYLSDLDGPAPDTFTEFLQYKLVLYSQDTDDDGYNDVGATVYSVFFKFNDELTPVSIGEDVGFQIPGNLHHRVLNIYSLNGKLVKRIPIEGTRLEHYGLNPGIYIGVIVEPGTGRRAIVRKFVIR